MEGQTLGEAAAGPSRAMVNPGFRGCQGLGHLDVSILRVTGLRTWVPREGRGRLTCTDDTGVLLVGADMGLPAPVGAEAQLPLAAPTGQLAQPHRPRALPEEGPSRGGQRAPTAQLAAGHGGVSQVPGVITHRPPAPAVPHLQAASAPMGAISQTQARGRAWMWGEGEQRDGELRWMSWYQGLHTGN